MALLHGQPPAGLIHHSDQGAQYTAGIYRKRYSGMACRPA